MSTAASSPSVLVSCPHCQASNRIPEARLGEQPGCGDTGEKFQLHCVLTISVIPKADALHVTLGGPNGTERLEFRLYHDDCGRCGAVST